MPQLKITAAEPNSSRFASLKSNEVNVRTGPGVRYKTKWVLAKKTMPMEIIADFEQWRKVRDFHGEEGWVHQSMLSGKRYLIISGKRNVTIYKEADTASKPTAYIEPGVIAAIDECSADWCKIKTDSVKGWVVKTDAWGINPREIID